MAPSNTWNPPVPEQPGGGVFADQPDFTLGKPSLVCRWRLASGKLPLENRLLRALQMRRVNGGFLTPEFIAWVKQQLEWSLAKGAAGQPDGVLMLVVDEEGRAALSVGPYEPLKRRTLATLSRRAVGAVDEALGTGVAPESIWIVRDGALVCGIDEGTHASGASMLVGDLAKTLGIPWGRVNRLAADLVNRRSSVDYDEVFLVSDEHGVVQATDAAGPMSTRLVEGYARLLQRQGSHRR